MRALAVILVLVAGPVWAGGATPERPAALVTPDGGQWVMEGCAAYQPGHTTGQMAQAAGATKARDRLRASFPPAKSRKQSRPATE